MSTHSDILSSEREIHVPGYTCRDCGSSKATHFWPGVGDKPEPYCKTCLDKRKHALAVALGIASY